MVLNTCTYRTRGVQDLGLEWTTITTACSEERDWEEGERESDAYTQQLMTSCGLHTHTTVRMHMAIQMHGSQSHDEVTQCTKQVALYSNSWLHVCVHVHVCLYHRSPKDQTRR